MENVTPVPGADITIYDNLKEVKLKQYEPLNLIQYICDECGECEKVTAMEYHRRK